MDQNLILGWMNIQIIHYNLITITPMRTYHFTENIFYLSDNFSITPGARYEFIKTATDGSYKKINTDAAGNVILNLSVDSSESRKEASHF